jgi:adenylosuccinate lyase
MLERAKALVEGLVVYPEALRANLDRARELFFSEAVLLALVGRGAPRQSAYEIVQRNAMKTLAEGGSFREYLAADRDVTKLLPASDLERCFDLSHSLRYANEIVDRALGDER